MKFRGAWGRDFPYYATFVAVVLLWAAGFSVLVRLFEQGGDPPGGTVAEAWVYLAAAFGTALLGLRLAEGRSPGSPAPRRHRPHAPAVRPPMEAPRPAGAAHLLPDPGGARGGAISMTEAEWLGCADPTPMLEFLHGRASDRKLQLFAVAACRYRYWEQVGDFAACRQVFEVAERGADGLAGPEELVAAYREAQAWADNFNDVIFGLVEPYGAVMSVARLTYAPAPSAAREVCVGKNGPDYPAKAPHQAALVRDIFGNPFRTAAFDPAWRTPTALKLAEAIYQDRAFDRLPILADALEEAGCDKGDLLAHLRDPGAHARGCWALDLVLAKE